MLLLLLLLLPLCLWKCLRHATKKMKRKDWKVDRALLSRDRKIRKLKEAVTSEKCDHVLSKLILIAKINVEQQKMLR